MRTCTDIADGIPATTLCAKKSRDRFFSRSAYFLVCYVYEKVKEKDREITKT
jgi:hypothetical protein